ncbi:hypothetical protein K443DRAFT_536341 [Laccaria amethystina LaAM-08-1]|uniref:Amine oxidase n=1 Tax=Laccaria amethystina LaAM-08-1 TaxID=1095629 RepID=A0A0C9XX28_9AGAR|nr:hypothetical protein K443DRAFT_536341 [Laccaria amethystina LaAM-08-1]
MAPDGTVVTGTLTAIQTSLGKHLSKDLNHPLDPLTPNEIPAITLAVRHYIAAKTEIKATKFITCSLLPAPKRAVLAHLGISLTPGGKPEEPVPIVRKAEVDFIDVVDGRDYNAILSSSDQAWNVDILTLLPEEAHSQTTVEELAACEVVVRNDPKVQALAKQVGILPEQMFCDMWSLGYDERFPQSRRVQQALVFARFSQHDNLYAHPMDFIPIVDVDKRECLHIDFPPHYVRTPEGAIKLSADSTAPPSMDADALAASGRERIPPPRRAWNFLPDLMADTEEGGYTPRTDVKPLHVVQPEGVSFKIDGHVLEWQNWKMHVAFSPREGIALSTITYNDHGVVRPIMYRHSLSEMVVPYGAPEHPHPRKFAFDSGEYGMGTMANELSLGCDCLGQIHYLPGSHVTHDGSAFVIKNAICIHEEDAGVLWKHSDFRPGGRSHTVRRRRLVISMVCTLANYDYIWNYHFYQDGSIEFEIRLTGALQTYVASNSEPSPHGMLVAPNINAHYHRHMFSIRVDPMIDGLNNTLIESDIMPLPDKATKSAANFAGNGFVSVDKVIEKEAGRVYDYAKERRWRIVNSAKKHYSSGRDVGYTLGVKGGATPMMVRDDSWAAVRAGFLTNTVWVCRDVEGEGGKWGSERMWPSGKYVPQTREQQKDSIGEWVKGELPVVDEDILVYLTVGTTHIPRPEDWPVMPVEQLSVSFKPTSFFKSNPSMDVPGTRDPLSAPAFGSSTPSNSNGTWGCSCQ